MNNLTLAYETNLRSILNHTNDLIVSKSSIGHALQARWTGINDTININANLNRFEGEKSTIASLVTSYKPRDGLTLSARYVQYDAACVQVCLPIWDTTNTQTQDTED